MIDLHVPQGRPRNAAPGRPTRSEHRPGASPRHAQPQIVAYRIGRWICRARPRVRSRTALKEIARRKQQVDSRERRQRHAPAAPGDSPRSANADPDRHHPPRQGPRTVQHGRGQEGDPAGPPSSGVRRFVGRGGEAVDQPADPAPTSTRIRQCRHRSASRSFSDPISTICRACASLAAHPTRAMKDRDQAGPPPSQDDRRAQLCHAP